MVGLIMSVGLLGAMLASSPLVLLAEALGWRGAVLLLAGVNACLAVLLAAVIRDRPPGSPTIETGRTEKPANGRSRETVTTLIKSPDYWAISWTAFIRYGVFAGIQALWAGPYLMEVMGYSALTTGNLILLLNTGMILGAPFWGAISDRLLNTRKWIIVAGSICITLTIIALAAIPSQTPLSVLALLFFCFGFFNATGLLMYPHIKELMPMEMSGSAMTGVNFFTMIGPAVFLQGLGSLMQTLYPEASRGPGAFDAAFILCIICLLIVTILYIFTNERRPEKQDVE